MAVLLGFVSQFVDDIVIVSPLLVLCETCWFFCLPSRGTPLTILDTTEKSRSVKEGK
jgi:hypothetical protein